ncbi:membrane-associated protein [[Clostridium] sordellii]|nr:membrane-associated protein [[Clostridium] sordellii] [Paeniclostridium sordellii]CEN87598.1 membrane-associated protein [[Clostridium] sordellii] [Paeniclostridium sordellii]CEO08585.1 membrane-associated protein [[Clostridium] sordellii] [Paeniclostridium sordellii]CEP90238.1 membrane-associated protein [[Clostridium] sordellii] [Paeniclostridium sordellii]CEQ21410.1 membrane-associated protein [[Clostridium] sordellii] [Paeniclostridium sordellii]
MFLQQSLTPFPLPYSLLLFCGDYDEGGIFMNSEIQTLIASVGFPIALSMYLLIRIEGKLQTLSDSINELSKNINIMKFK